MGFSKNPLLDPWNLRWLRSAIFKIDMSLWSNWDKISQTGAEWHVDCGDMVKIETKCRIPIWRMFGRIRWHVIPEPHITLQGAATWWIHCHDSRATCQCHDCATLQGVRIPSGILKIVFRHILFYFFLFLMQFRLWRAAAFVSSPIHLLLLSRRSRQRERLSGSVLSICSSDCLSVCRQNAKITRFSQKLSNLELWCLLTAYRKLCNWAVQRTHYLIPKIQDGWNPPSWKSTWRHFFLPRVVRFG